MLPCPLQVLTRRDQLKFKEEKQKNENPEDACDDTKEEDGEEPEPAQKKKVRANAKKAKGEGKANGKAKAKDKAETKAKVSKGKKNMSQGWMRKVMINKRLNKRLRFLMTFQWRKHRKLQMLKSTM